MRLRLEVGDRLFGVRERLGGALLDFGQGGEQLGGVVGLARAGDGEPQVLEERHRFLDDRAQFGEERGQVLGRRLRRFDQRVEVVEGGAEVDEGRVALAEDRRQPAQGLAEGGVLAGDRAEGGGGVGDRVGEVVAALGDRGRELARS